MTPTQQPTFSWRVIGGGGGFSYLLASGGSGGSINFDFTTGVLPGAITFTRASIGTYNSSGNVLTTASANAARFNYIAGVANLLIEGSATNLFPQSNDFSSLPWGSNNAPVITGGAFISPDGTNNGWSITTGTGNAQLFQTIIYPAGPCVASVWVKRIVGTANHSVVMDGSSVPGSPFTLSTTLTRIPGTRSAVGGSNLLVFTVTASAGNTNGYFGAQLETGSTPTSYIPTTTAAVARAADSATFIVPSGVGHLTYTFDDNTTQLVTVSAGSYTIPTTLNRPNIKSIMGSA